LYIKGFWEGQIPALPEKIKDELPLSQYYIQVI
jgi:hypothetical protein